MGRGEPGLREQRDVGGQPPSVEEVRAGSCAWGAGGPLGSKPRLIAEGEELGAEGLVLRDKGCDTGPWSVGVAVTLGQKLYHVWPHSCPPARPGIPAAAPHCTHHASRAES